MVKIYSQKNKEFFETSDLGLAATLILNGFEPTIEKERDRGIFIFDYGVEVKQRVSDYYADKVGVAPRLFLDQIRSLKARLSNIK